MLCSQTQHFRCFPIPLTRPLKGLYAAHAKSPKPDTKSFRSPLSTENSYNEKPKKLNECYLCVPRHCLSLTAVDRGVKVVQKADLRRDTVTLTTPLTS